MDLENLIQTTNSDASKLNKNVKMLYLLIHKKYEKIQNQANGLPIENQNIKIEELYPTSENDSPIRFKNSILTLHLKLDEIISSLDLINNLLHTSHSKQN